MKNKTKGYPAPFQANFDREKLAFLNLANRGDGLTPINYLFSTEGAFEFITTNNIIAGIAEINTIYSTTIYNDNIYNKDTIISKDIQTQTLEVAIDAKIANIEIFENTIKTWDASGSINMFIGAGQGSISINPFNAADVALSTGNINLTTYGSGSINLIPTLSGPSGQQQIGKVNIQTLQFALDTVTTDNSITATTTGGSIILQTTPNPLAPMQGNIILNTYGGGSIDLVPLGNGFLGQRGFVNIQTLQFSLVTNDTTFDNVITNTSNNGSILVNANNINLTSNNLTGNINLTTFNSLTSETISSGDIALNTYGSGNINLFPNAIGQEIGSVLMFGANSDHYTIPSLQFNYDLNDPQMQILSTIELLINTPIVPNVIGKDIFIGSSGDLSISSAVAATVGDDQTYGNIYLSPGGITQSNPSLIKNSLFLGNNLFMPTYDASNVIMSASVTDSNIHLLPNGNGVTFIGLNLSVDNYNDSATIVTKQGDMSLCANGSLNLQAANGSLNLQADDNTFIFKTSLVEPEFTPLVIQFTAGTQTSAPEVTLSQNTGARDWALGIGSYSNIYLNAGDFNAATETGYVFIGAYNSDGTQDRVGFAPQAGISDQGNTYTWPSPSQATQNGGADGPASTSPNALITVTDGVPSVTTDTGWGPFLTRTNTSDGVLEWTSQALTSGGTGFIANTSDYIALSSDSTDKMGILKWYNTTLNAPTTEGDMTTDLNNFLSCNTEGVILIVTATVTLTIVTVDGSGNYISIGGKKRPLKSLPKIENNQITVDGITYQIPQFRK